MTRKPVTLGWTRATRDLTHFDVFPYEPIPTDTLQESLDRFDAERADIDSERERLADLEDTHETTFESCDEAVDEVLRFYAPDGHDVPQNEEVRAAYRAAVGKLSQWVMDDTSAQTGFANEFTRQLLAIFTAVGMAYTEESRNRLKKAAFAIGIEDVNGNSRI